MSHVRITPAERPGMRHDNGYCWCSVGGWWPLEDFSGKSASDPEVQEGAELDARAAAARLSGEGLSSRFYYRGTEQACMWLLGRGSALGVRPGEGPAAD